MSMSPRPILKQRSLTTAEPRMVNNACVHFPPSPALTRTFTAHSSSVYDRSPIVVSRNSCALPERGCPGRTYLLDEQSRPPSDVHPRALAFSHRASSSTSYSAYPPVPALIPDLSSESEESDSWSCLTGDLLSSPSNFSIHGLKASSATNGDLSFLPYSPASDYHFIEEESPLRSTASKPRRKRGERRHESSRDNDRIPRTPSPVVEDATLGMGALSISPPSPTSFVSRSSHSSTRKKGVRTQHRVSVVAATTTTTFGFAATDDGCLGGF